MTAIPVGQEVRRRREQRGLSLTDLARLSGVSKGYLSEIENNPTARPSGMTLFKIASALDTTVEELLGGDGDGPTCLGREVPKALRQFAEEAKLPEAEIRMLAGLSYRGKPPKTVEDWRYIYESIRLRVMDDFQTGRTGTISAITQRNTTRASKVSFSAS